jgi:hypothetical protein
MGRMARRQARKPLADTLAEIRRDKANGKSRPKKVTRFGKVGGSEFTKNQKGHQIEKPSIHGLNWLRMFAEALKLTKTVWDCRVSTERWEQDGCVTLHLQEALHADQGQSAVTVGARGLVMTAGQDPIDGDRWKYWRVPIGLINNHDARALLKLITTPKDVDLVLASNRLVRAIHGH